MRVIYEHPYDAIKRLADNPPPEHRVEKVIITESEAMQIATKLQQLDGWRAATPVVRGESYLLFGIRVEIQ